MGIIPVELTLYNILRDWSIECNASMSIDIHEENKCIDIYSDRPGALVGYRGSIIDKYRERMKKECVLREDWNFKIRSSKMIITPKSKKISRRAYDRELKAWMARVEGKEDN